MERAVSLNMEHLDFVVEESWRWALSCARPRPGLPAPCPQLHARASGPLPCGAPALAACRPQHALTARMIGIGLSYL